MKEKECGFLLRLPQLYANMCRAATHKALIHRNKGDWLKRDDKHLGRLVSGLIIEIGEFNLAVTERDAEKALNEGGDILNYLVMILEKLEAENFEGEKNGG